MSRIQTVHMSDRLLNEKRLAKIALKERDFSKAVRLNRAMLETHGSDLSGEEAAAINLDIGACLLRLGELNGAAAAFAEAVRLDPANERAQFLDAEWSGKLSATKETAADATDDAPMPEFTSEISNTGATYMIDPLGRGGERVSLGPGGVDGVPHAERRPPFDWRLLAPVVCVVAVCLIVIVLRSL